MVHLNAWVCRPLNSLHVAHGHHVQRVGVPPDTVWGDAPEALQAWMQHPLGRQTPYPDKPPPFTPWQPDCQACGEGGC